MWQFFSKIVKWQHCVPLTCLSRMFRPFHFELNGNEMEWNESLDYLQW